jgi:cytochrome b subunit of formate dehydrogenase
LEICDKAENREEEGEYPCDEFIEANIEDHADAVRWLLDEIKNHEDDSVQSSNALYTRDQIVQWTLVALAFMLTITTTITQAYPKLKIRKIDLAMVPIALAAFSAAVTSLSVYYQFDDYRRLNQTVAN